MAHKNLGIIQIDLPEITLAQTFGNDNATDITSLLSNEQISLIKYGLKGEKSVVINGVIKDTQDIVLTLKHTLFNVYNIDDEDSLTAHFVDYQNGMSYSITIFTAGDEIKIYS